MIKKIQQQIKKKNLFVFYSTVRNKNISLSFTFVLLIAAILLISHTLYVTKTFGYPEWDEHKYLGAAIHFLPILRHPDIHFFQNMLAVQKAWLPSAPPLYPIMIDIPLLLFGTFHTYKIAMWMNIIFYSATIFSIYFLGKEFFSKKVSALVAFIFALYGFPLFYLNFVYTETAGTAFTTLALCFLAKSDKFKNTRNVFLFGLFCAFAVLTRWTTPLFIIGPFLIILLQTMQEWKSIHKKIFLKNLIILLLLCLLPLALYYFPNKEEFLFYLKSGSANGASWMPAYLRNPFSGHSFIWYISIIAQQTIWFYFLFLSGFFLAICYFKKYAFLLSAFIIPFIFFTFFTTFKDDRFIVPLYPSIALLSAIVFSFVEKLHWEKIFNGLLVITVVIGFFNFLGTSWGIGPMKFSTSGSWKNVTLPNSILMPMPIGHPRRVWLSPISWPPRPDEGRADSIMNIILKDWHKTSAPRVLFTFEMNQINDMIYGKIAYEQLDVIKMHDLMGIETNDYKSFFNDFKDTDYVLTKNGTMDNGIHLGKSPKWDEFISYVRLFNDREKKYGNILPSAFAPIKSIFIPFDNSTVVIYKKQRDISEEEWVNFGTVFKTAHDQNGQEIDISISSMTN